MRLNSTSPINFKYNPQFHEQVHKNLAARKKDNAYAKQLIEADKFTLELEDEVIRMEQNKKANTVAYKNITHLLMDLKHVIAEHMSSTFGKQNYCESLIDTYTEEGANAKNPNACLWREELACELIDYLPPSKKVVAHSDQDLEEIWNKQQEEKAKLEESQKDKKIDDLVKEIKDAVTDELKAPGASLLTEFKPTYSSPKGFCDVVGFEQQKQEFEEEIITYILDPEQAKLDEEEYGIRAPRGYLFYGPPGCGKTFMTEALAAETGLSMYKMDVSKVGSKFVNESSNNIQQAFDYVAHVAQKDAKPVLLFMDEVDSLAMKRTQSTGGVAEDLKATTTLLKLIEGSRDQGIIVIAASNKYDLLDEAFVARFDGQKYFGLPDEEQIIALLKHALLKRSKGVELANNDEELANLSKELKGFSNRSIVFLVDAAAKLAKRNNRSNITTNDILEATKNTELQKVNENDFKKHNKTRHNIGFN